MTGMEEAHIPSSGHVSSVSNPAVKLLRALDRKKTRAETGLFLAEGARLVQEGLDNGWEPELLLAGEEASRRPHLARLLDHARGMGARVITTTEKVLGAVARKDNPQTVLAAFRQRALELDAIQVSANARFVALWQVRDPGNLGTIIRTADAAGVAGVILVGGCCDPYSVECVRATMGSLFAMPLAETTPEAFRSWRSKIRASVTAASVNGRIRHDEAAFGQPSIVLMGNEQSGIPPEIEASCDTLVRIPMKGAADSLNLAQATAIMIYAVWKEQGYDGAKD